MRVHSLASIFEIISSCESPSGSAAACSALVQGKVSQYFKTLHFLGEGVASEGNTNKVAVAAADAFLIWFHRINGDECICAVILEDRTVSPETD